MGAVDTGAYQTDITIFSILSLIITFGFVTMSTCTDTTEKRIKCKQKVHLKMALKNAYKTK
jgi:hypothetical protein